MDYCSSCRRHLNGALVCPGCGAYAPDIAPPTAMGRSTGIAMGTASDTDTRAAVDSWYDDDAPAGAAPAVAGEAPRFEPSGDVDGPPPAPRGRAARRRQLARWKKNKRRAAVATAVALVGGGLTLASMDRQSGDRAQAAAAPDDRSMGARDGEASADTGPATPAPDAHRTAHGTAPRHARQAASDTSGRQALAAAPRTAASNTRTDAAATGPLPARTPAAQQQGAAPASGSTTTGGTTTGGTGTNGSGTSAQQPADPAPAPSTGTGSDTGTSTSTSPSTSTTSPSSDPTSPSHLCLLVVCLG
ncbi:SCO2400 family protein [Streptomyces bungoensis]|uniref:SCO2400 family protein n=1 Tax=Streptomyces bungoensis TaxID=285568 RepID=UPI00343E182F